MNKTAEAAEREIIECEMRATNLRSNMIQNERMSKARPQYAEVYAERNNRLLLQIESLIKRVDEIQKRKVALL